MRLTTAGSDAFFGRVITTLCRQAVAARPLGLRIPGDVDQGFPFDVGRRFRGEIGYSDLMSATPGRGGVARPVGR